MKKKAIYTVLISVVCISVFSCKKMDDVYKEYVVPNGMIYPAKASSPMVYAGNGRVQISWERGNDPNVRQAVVYWNNFTDSIVVSIPEQGNQINQVIQPLGEGTYTFVIKTFDDEGRTSVPVEISGRAYGMRYHESLLGRPLAAALLDINGNLNLQWADADIANGAIRTEISYTNKDNIQKVLHVSVDSIEAEIEDYRGGAAFQYRTAFVPDSLAIDTFYTDFETSGPFKFDKKDWSVVDVSSEHPGAANVAVNLIDDTDATRWHANATASNYPHFVTFDLGAERTISRLGVWGTTNAFNPVDPRGPDKIQFLVSNDNSNWTDLGTFDFNRLINGEQLYDFESLPKARYIKLVAVAGPERFTVLGEFSAYGY